LFPPAAANKLNLGERGRLVLLSRIIHFQRQNIYHGRQEEVEVGGSNQLIGINSGEQVSATDAHVD
jgi:hypothetical protein